MTTGVTQGRITKARAMFMPRSFWLRRSATARPRTTWKKTENTVQMISFSMTSQK